MVDYSKWDKLLLSEDSETDSDGSLSLSFDYCPSNSESDASSAGHSDSSSDVEGSEFPQNPKNKNGTERSFEDEKKCWSLIEDANWEVDPYVERIQDEWSKLPAATFKMLEQFIREKDSALFDKFRDDWAGRNGVPRINASDDSWSDLRHEVIGRGERFYNEITADKLRVMADTGDYEESFAYCLHVGEEYEVSWGEGTTRRIPTSSSSSQEQDKRCDLQRKCACCLERKTFSVYSKNQWGKGCGISRCKTCIKEQSKQDRYNGNRVYSKTGMGRPTGNNHHSEYDAVLADGRRQDEEKQGLKKQENQEDGNGKGKEEMREEWPLELTEGERSAVVAATLANAAFLQSVAVGGESKGTEGEHAAAAVDQALRTVQRVETSRRGKRTGGAQALARAAERWRQARPRGGASAMGPPPLRPAAELWVRAMRAGLAPGRFETVQAMVEKVAAVAATTDAADTGAKLAAVPELAVAAEAGAGAGTADPVALVSPSSNQPQAPEPPPSRATEERTCTSCHELKPRNSFAAKQWKKKSKNSKCQSCFKAELKETKDDFPVDIQNQSNQGDIPLNLGSVSVKELRSRLQQLGVEHSQCIEKADLVQLLANSSTSADNGASHGQEKKTVPNSTHKARPLITSLSKWNYSKSMKEPFEKAFTLGEKLRHARASESPGLLAEGVEPDTPGFKLRYELGRLATNFEGVYHKHQNQGRVPGVFLLPSKDQKHGMLVQVRDVLEDMHREENPVFFVQWAKMQTGDPRNIALVNAVINEINMNKQELVHLLVEPEVQQLLHAELLKNRGPDGKYSVPAPTRGGMQTSYLTVVAPPDDAGFLRKPPKPARACAQCGAAAAHACSRCQAVYYCSRAHQTAHWRTGGHKAACRSAAEAAGARGVDAASGSVVIAATAPPEWAEKFAGVPGFAHQSTIKPGKKQRAPTNVHGDGTFLVKLQVPMGGSGGFLPIMIYDKERSFDRMLMPDEPGFDKLGEITRREPAFQGTKIYLNAKREADTFRIFLSPVPPQRQYF